MDFVIRKLEGNTNKLLIGQFINEKKCHVYFEYDLLNPLGLLLDDLSVKQSLSEFLNKIQDITSLISVGLKPIGLYFRGEMPEYCRNNSILKKICSVFNVDCLLLHAQNLKQCFNQKTITTTHANIKVVEQFQLIRVNLRTYLNFNLGEEIDINYSIEKIKKKYDSLPLIHNNQIVTEFSGKPMSFQYFLPNTQQVDCLQSEFDSQKILQGHVVVHLLVDSSLNLQELKALLLADLIESLRVRLNNLTQTPCYLATRLLVSFKNSPLILQNYIDHEFNKEQESNYIKQLFPDLDIEEIQALENLHTVQFQEIIKEAPQQVKQVEQPLQPQEPQPQPQPQPQPPQINTQQFRQEYLIMIAIIGLLVAIYLKTLF